MSDVVVRFGDAEMPAECVAAILSAVADDKVAGLPDALRVLRQRGGIVQPDDLDGDHGMFVITSSGATFRMCWEWDAERWRVYS